MEVEVGVACLMVEEEEMGQEMQADSRNENNSGKGFSPGVSKMHHSFADK